MSSLTFAEKACFEKLLAMELGLVLGFNNRTFAEFFLDVAGVDIYDSKYEMDGTSKANRLRAFWRLEPDDRVAAVMTELVKLAELSEGLEKDARWVAVCTSAIDRLGGTGGGAEVGRPEMKCFVIQPFDDGGEFDRRFEQIIDPAIRSAGLEPYRVDRDPSATVIIDAIEQQIRDSAVVLADISTDNPNVWYELGFARAIGKETVIICSAERERLPFDIQHRAVLKYGSGSPSDFERLREDTAQRLFAAMQKDQQLTQIEDLVSMTSDDCGEGLRPYEVAALAVVAAQTLGPSNVATGSDVGEAMQKQGFNGTATSLALRTLQAQGFVAVDEYTENDWNNSYTYEGYKLTDIGVMWLREHEGLLELQTIPKHAAAETTPIADDPDEIPF